VRNYRKKLYELFFDEDWSLMEILVRLLNVRWKSHSRVAAVITSFWWVFQASNYCSFFALFSLPLQTNAVTMHGTIKDNSKSTNRRVDCAFCDHSKTNCANRSIIFVVRDVCFEFCFVLVRLNLEALEAKVSQT
jgi:hypothetical protein